jgi:hypothetical protein
MSKMTPLWICAWTVSGIDDGATIDRADDAPDANRSVTRHVASEN